MEIITGVFKNADTTITIVSTPKDIAPLSDPMSGQIRPQNLGELFGRALATDVGKCTMVKGGIVVELTYTYSKGFLVTKDNAGNESVFAHRFDRLFYLDPAGEFSLILGR